MSSNHSHHHLPNKKEIKEFLEQLSEHSYARLLHRALGVLVRAALQDLERLDWKILTGSLEDLERAYNLFRPYRHRRKVTIFGSARITRESPIYSQTVEFARRITEAGFMVLTGGGGGIMEAGNQGAGREHSFGLNVRLPFEQAANPFIADDPKLIYFKYFFIRKLFFLRESDAIALFPGGFGTQDEAFEALTLCQTGKYGPAPLVLIDEPNGTYWRNWHQYIQDNLVPRNLIRAEDVNLYTITDDLAIACQTIQNFYRVYHSSRYVEHRFVMRLNQELTAEQVDFLNEEFEDLLREGKIYKSSALPQEKGDPTYHLPRLVFSFNQGYHGRLYQLINRINELAPSLDSCPFK